MNYKSNVPRLNFQIYSIARNEATKGIYYSEKSATHQQDSEDLHVFACNLMGEELAER